MLCLLCAGRCLTASYTHVCARHQAANRQALVLLKRTGLYPICKLSRLSQRPWSYASPARYQQRMAQQATAASGRLHVRSHVPPCTLWLGAQGPGRDPSCTLQVSTAGQAEQPLVVPALQRRPCRCACSALLWAHEPAAADIAVVTYRRSLQACNSATLTGPPSLRLLPLGR